VSLRVCTEPGCPTLVTSGRCAPHRSEREKARGSRQQRGYDATHDALRASWVRKVATGAVTCWRCGELIAGDFDLGHDDHDRSKYRGPECIPCNRGTATRR
jgi:hypothetical protein